MATKPCRAGCWRPGTWSLRLAHSVVALDRCPRRGAISPGLRCGPAVGQAVPARACGLGLKFKFVSVLSCSDPAGRVSGQLV